MLQTLILHYRNLFLAKTEVLKIAIGILLLFASAQLSIPLKPVPITLQSMSLILIGLTYKPKEALCSVGAYLALGALGLPVFAHYNSGVIYLTGKTGGYLVGFLAMVMVMSTLQAKQSRHKFFSTLGICLAGQTVLYCCGISWLTTFIGLKGAITYGLLPFIIPGVVKSLLLSFCLQAIGYFKSDAQP